MKKTNLKKYILEALGVLLVIAACLAVHTLSEREAYAEDNVNLTLNTEGTTKVYYSGRAEEYKDEESNITSYSIQVTKKDGSDVMASGTVKIGESKDITFAYADDGEYTIKIVGCTFSDGTQFDNCTNTAEATMSGKSISFTINNLEIETKTPAPLPTVNLKLNLTGTTKVYYSGRVEEYKDEESNITSYSIQVTKKDGSDVMASGTVKIGESKDITFAYADDGEYTIKIVGCTFSDGTQFDNCTNTAEATMSGKSISFTINNLEIETKTPAPLPTVNLKLNLTGTTKVYYSGKSIEFSGEESKIKNYKVQVVKQGESTVLATAEITPGQATDVQFASATDGNYVLSITGCTFTDGTVYKSATTDPTSIIGELKDKQVSFTINNLSIETTTSAVDKATVGGGTSGDDDSIKVTWDESDIRTILASQTDAKTKEAIDTAILNGQTIKLELVVDNDDYSSSEKKKIEEEVDDDKSGKVGKAFDLSLKIVIGSSKYYVTDTGDTSIKIKYTIPSNLKSSSSTSGKRYYRVYYYHDKVRTANDWDVPDSSTITFKASKFSTYAIAYYDDGSKSSSSSSNAGSNSASVKNTIDTTTSGNNASGKSPKTGDDFNPRIWIYLLIVAATIATCAGVLLQETKDDNSKKGNNG